MRLFVDVVLSPNTNASMMGRALVSLNKFLLYGACKLDSPNTKKAVNLTVCSIVECQFESNDQHNDEMILMQLLDVLVNFNRCPAV